MKKLIILIIAILLNIPISQAGSVVPVPGQVKIPSKYTTEYLETIAEEYKKVSNQQIFHVALDMMKDSTANFSRKAILGYNLTQKPIKIDFKNLG